MGNEWDVSIPRQPVTNTASVIHSTPLPRVFVLWFILTGPWLAPGCLLLGRAAVSMAITG